MMITKKHFTNYIQCLEEERYFDAHEALEELWFPRRFEVENSEVMLLKGFINAAVSFELVKRGREESALRVWKNYEKYIVLLERIESAHKERYMHLQEVVERVHKQLHTKATS